MGLRGAVAAGAVALAVVAGARAQECNTTIAETAAEVPDLSTLVSVVTIVAGEETLAEEARPFLDAIQDPAAEVTAFAPVNAAFEPLEGVDFGYYPELNPEFNAEFGFGFNPAAVLMFHAVPGMMEAGKAYDTAAGPDAGQLVVNEAGDTVTGPCNSANVSMTVDACGSVAHVIDAVLLPASFCADSAQTEDGEDHDDDKDGDLESEDVEDDVEEISEGGDEEGESVDEEIDGYFEEGR